jgi:hypothetical protein
MLTKGKLALAAVMMLGVASTAQASDHGENGGFDIGPLGQCFVPPDCGHGSLRAREYRNGPYGFAYVPGYRYRHPRLVSRAVSPAGRELPIN